MRKRDVRKWRVPLLLLMVFALIAAFGAVVACSVEDVVEAGGVENEGRMLDAAATGRGYVSFEKMEPVATEFIADKDRMKDVMRELFRKDYPGNRFQAMNALMVKFGFSMFENKSEDEIVDDYTKGILGLYDHEKKQIYVISSGLYEQLRLERYDECKIDRIVESEVWNDWNRKHVEDIVLVHEAAHAMQDQNFDLYDKREKFRHNDDASFAVSAMVEGGAEYVEDEYVTDLLKIGSVPRFYEYGISWDLELFSKIDEFVEEEDKNSEYQCDDDMTFLWWLNAAPYFIGKIFVTKISHEQGRNAINSTFEKCPLSSEQIMNSNKYFSVDKEDLPTFINMPSFDDLIDIKKMRYLDYNSMGELKLYLLCRDMYYDPTRDCKPMAEGWDGDRYIVWMDEDENILLAWYTTWDNDDDADEFYKFYMDARSRKTLKEGKQKSGAGWHMELVDEESMYIQKKGKDVIIVEGELGEDDFIRFAYRVWESEKYEADYGICTKTRFEFVDKYAGYTGEDDKGDGE